MGKKIALVTGAGGGIGAAVVKRLSNDGYAIAAMDLNKTSLEAALIDLPNEARAWIVDQTDENEVRKAVEEIETQMGPIDVLVNVTGWVGGSRFEAETSDYWKKIVDINFNAMLYISHAVLVPMIERRRGKMIFFASDAGKVGTSTEAVYAATKAGVIAFAKSLARENARHNIYANSVCPGPTQTPLLEAELLEKPDIINRMTKLVPFRRLGKPEEQAAVVSFLASSDSDYVTGQSISVSGGLTMC